MISLSRTRAAAVIPAGFRDAGRVANQADVVKLHRANQEFKSRVWKAAKAQLRAETHNKCAYCEADTSVVAHGDVEHFRPKSHYWWLAYCYDNYLFSCQICNQVYKGDNFPVNQPRMAAPALPDVPTSVDIAAISPDPLDQVSVSAFLAQCLAEEAGIPNPYELDPETLFVWTADHTLREVEIQPRDASPRSQRAFDAAHRFLGLNRPELKRLRYERLRILTVLFTTLSSRPAPAARQATEDLLRHMMSDSNQFAGMCRYFVREVEGLPL